MEKATRVRCGRRPCCKLKELANKHILLVERDSDASNAHLRNLDFKFLFLLCISVHTGENLVAEDQGRKVLADFPLRVRPDKHLAWLGLISKVRGRDPDLGDWGNTGNPWNDLFLDWVHAEWADAEAEFHQEMQDCLVKREV
jgi:hypothetical protein